MSRSRLIVALVLLLAVVVAAIELQRSDRVDFSPNYEHDANAAMGGRIVHDILPELVGGAPVTRTLRSPYASIRDTTITGTTYFFLTENLPLDSLSTAALVEFVHRGNTVFLSAERLSPWLSDTLGLRIGWKAGLPVQRIVTTDTLQLAGPTLRQAGGYALADRVEYRFISAYDTARTTPLGADLRGNVNYAHIAAGDGGFFVHTAPRVFGNFHFVQGDGADYVAAALSHLPPQPVIWDAVYKPQRTTGGTPLRFIQESPELSWAYYTLLLGFVLFVTFRGRRWQRAIPVVRPPENETARFARAIARLWHERGDDRQLVERRLRHARDRLRQSLHDPDLHLDAETAPSIARRLSIPEDVMTDLVDLGQRLGSTRRPKTRDLIRFDRLLDQLHHAI